MLKQQRDDQLDDLVMGAQHLTVIANDINSGIKEGGTLINQANKDVE